MLWAATGEHAEPGLAQDTESLGGKILRMNPDGAPAPGNPSGTLVWTYGHRNIEGMAWDSAGRMYATEFGQDRFDEVNRIVRFRYSGGQIGPLDAVVTGIPRAAVHNGGRLAFGPDGMLWAATARGAAVAGPVRPCGPGGRPGSAFRGRVRPAAGGGAGA